jgi:hypothetical protein
MCDTCIKIFDDQVVEKTITLREKLVTEEKEILQLLKAIEARINEEITSGQRGYMNITVSNCGHVFDTVIFDKMLTLRADVLKGKEEINQFMNSIMVWLDEEMKNGYVPHNCINIQNRILGLQMVPTFEQMRVWKCVNDPNFNNDENSKQICENFKYFDKLLAWLTYLIVQRKKTLLVKKPTVKRVRKHK